MPAPADDPLLRSSQREALFATALWLAAGLFSIGYCARYAYNRPAGELTFVCGVPDWVFWGIVVPWTACTAVSCLFAWCIMCDDPLGDDAASDPVLADAAALHADESAASASERSERRDG